MTITEFLNARLDHDRGAPLMTAEYVRRYYGVDYKCGERLLVGDR